MEETFLERIVYTFTQECNTLGTTGGSNDSEKLEVIVEAPVGSIIKDGGFLVLKTEGWSINDHTELISLLKAVEAGIPSKIKKE